MNINEKITVLILAGGKGTRLRSVVSDRPKVLAQINDRPFLSYLLDKLDAEGFRNVILCTGYMGDMVQDCFGDSYKRLSLSYSHEREPLGTGGAIRLALPLINTDMIMVMNGDSYIDADLTKYTNWYCDRKAKASLLLTEVDDTSRYGRVNIDGSQVVLSFEEKGSNSGKGWINSGIYLFAKDVVSDIPVGCFFSIEKDFFPTLTGGKLLGHTSRCDFIDIGTEESFGFSEAFFCQINI